MRIGVLGLQGGFLEHGLMMKSLGAEVVTVRRPAQLHGLHGLIIPGGESPVIGMLMQESGLAEELPECVERGMKLFGTCAGLILLAAEIVGRQGSPQLGLIDLAVERNSYGRQIDSFEADIAVEFLDSRFRAVFIRAPRVRRVGPGVMTLASCNGDPVLLRRGGVLVAGFHPELSGDDRIHRYFLQMCASG